MHTVLLNLSEEGIFLRKGEILRHLEKEDITVEEITIETMLKSENMELACAAYKFLPNEHSKETHSFLCLEETQFYLSINYYNHRCDIWAIIRISYQCKHLKIFMR